MAQASKLTGKRVLVVEDEMMISMWITDILADEHCQIIGPFHRVALALDAARHETLDLAVLDVNIAGELVFPVAEILSARRIPFVFLSGYGQSALPPERKDWVMCNKPFEPEALVALLTSQIGKRA